jgi:hypothetical protein
MAGARSALLFQLPDNCPSLDVLLEIHPVIIGKVESQHLEIHANNACVFSGRLTTRERVRFSIGRNNWQSSGTLEIRLHCPDYLIPSSIDAQSADHRLQGVFCRLIQFSDALSPWEREPSPYLPFDQTIDAKSGLLRPYLGKGWSELRSSGAQMQQRHAELNFSILKEKRKDYILMLKFKSERNFGSLRRPVSLYYRNLRIGMIDLCDQTELSAIVPSQVEDPHGRICLELVADELGPVSTPVHQITEQEATGPCLIGLKLRSATIPGNLSRFELGRPIRFSKMEDGRAFLGKGWNDPDEKGVVSSDVYARIQGAFLGSDYPVYITASVYSVTDIGPLASQNLTLSCNGLVLARCRVEGRTEVTAVMPPGYIAVGGALALQFEVSVVGSPANCRAGQDNRVLGLGLESLLLS